MLQWHCCWGMNGTYAIIYMAVFSVYVCAYKGSTSFQSRSSPSNTPYTLVSHSLDSCVGYPDCFRRRHFGSRLT